MNINLEYYKTFYYVAKNKSISKSAVELSISQPAISKVIKTLEEQLDTQLFIRKRNGVELTESGEKIYQKIKNALDLIDSAENDLKSSKENNSGILNIGASKTIIQVFLMPYITKFHQEYPHIKIRIFTDSTQELIKKADLGLIDVIFANLPYKISKNYQEYKLIDLHDCLVANDSYSYLKNKKLTKKDLENLPLLVLTKGTITRTRLDNYCMQNNIHLKIEMEFGSNSLIKEFTLAGFGIGMLTEEHIKEELSNNKLFKLNINLPLKKKYLGMLWNKDNKNNVFQKFVSFIKDTP